MHFTKTSRFQPQDYEFSKWHHIGLGGFLEWSDPVNLKQICPDSSWSSVRVQTGFLQGFVRKIWIPTGSVSTEAFQGETPARLPVGTSVGNFYSPEEVSVSCK